MAKPRTIYVCNECGTEFPAWSGRCSECGEWNTLEETIHDTDAEKKKASKSRRQSPLSITDNPPQRLTDITADRLVRIQLPMREFGRVLGGGIVPGSLALIGGDPGIGKSTLLLQVAGNMAGSGATVLYVSGEESAHQIKIRAQRLGIDTPELYLLSETHLDTILDHIEKLEPSAIIIDSIQTMYIDELSSSAGSVTQVRECASQLLREAKTSNTPIFLVGHVTKQGNIAGPRVLEHIVDAVLYMEGDRYHAYRLLRSVKNRFGSTNEVGVFEMSERGLIEVDNPSELFLSEYEAGATGSAVAVTLEGTRPLLVELQALSTTTAFSQPRRTANGIDNNRLYLLLAVLSKRVGLNMHNQDIFVNVVGGLRISEPAVDLAIAVAIASSFRERPVPRDIALIGEIGLGGELRAVGQIERRLREAAELGFTRCIVPRTGRRQIRVDGIETVPCRSVVEALQTVLKKQK